MTDEATEMKQRRRKWYRDAGRYLVYLMTSMAAEGKQFRRNVAMEETQNRANHSSRKLIDGSRTKVKCLEDSSAVCEGTQLLLRSLIFLRW
jgi:hypothetical protein